MIKHWQKIKIGEYFISSRHIYRKEHVYSIHGRITHASPMCPHEKNPFIPDPDDSFVIVTKRVIYRMMLDLLDKIYIDK